MRLPKKGYALLAAIGIIAATPALADMTVKDSGGNATTLGTLVISGVHYAKHVLVDGNGALFGTPANPISTFTDCTVLGTGADSAYTAGQTQPCTLSPTGRLRVGLSSAAINGATLAGSSDLQGAQGVDGNQYPHQLDGRLNLKVVNQTGIGAMTAVPAGTTNGTALLTSLPAGGTGVRFYLGANDSVTFTIAPTAPTSAPTNTFKISGASGGTGPNWDENLAGGQMIYVLATTGAPQFRPY